MALCSLALADAAFSGFRAHAGRDGRIAKRDAKTAAALTGAAAGLTALAVLGAILAGAMAVDVTDYDELVDAGSSMLAVYAVYATAVAVGFVAYFSPWLEMRSLATMLVLGPGTFVRPAVIFAGAVLAGISGGWSIAALAFVAATTMLGVEPMLWYWFDHRQATSIAPFAPAPRRRLRRRR